MNLKTRMHDSPERRYPESLGRQPPVAIHAMSASLLLAAVLAACLLDVPVARYFAEHPLPGSVIELHNVAELFGHGVGVGIVVVVLWMLDPGRRWAIPRLALAAWGGGMAANLLKMCVGRVRPYAFDPAELTSSWPSFRGMFPGTTVDSALQSFPSAHVATAVGLAVVLSRLYPHGRGLFVTLALTVASQRIGGQAHFVSDCCFGALVGWAAGQFTFQERWASIWFDRLEFLLGRPRFGAPSLEDSERGANDPPLADDGPTTRAA